MPATSHAFVESPLQFLSCLEAHEPGEHLIIHARKKAAGMSSFLAQLPPELLRDGIELDTKRPHPRTLVGMRGRILIGDPFSGKLQKPLVMAYGRIKASFVLLDDGYATIRAIRLLSSPTPAPLVRSKTKVKPSRAVMGGVAARVLRQAMAKGRLRWVTALPVDQDLASLFTAAGGTITQHRFERLRAAKLGDTTGPEFAYDRFVLGSALAADGLIDPDRYVTWVTAAASAGPTVYLAHRRQSSEILARLEKIPGLSIRTAGLPVELRLAHAPHGSQIFSLPSSALATLPSIMDAPELEVTTIDESWWTAQAPDSLRQELNSHAVRAREDAPEPERAGTPTRIVSVSDSESYLKWAAHTLQHLGDGFARSLWLIDSPLRPTAEQITNALEGTVWAGTPVPVIKRRDLLRELRAENPDLVLAAATGPVVQQIFASAASLPRRPGLISGLPGVALPARAKGIQYRRAGDVFIVHSESERRAYEAVAAKCEVPTEVVVARLPMLTHLGLPALRFDTLPVPARVIFAPQAKVPAERSARISILRALTEFKRQNPDSEVVIKVRSRAGEQETHHEEFTYLSLLEELIDDGAIQPGELVVQAGPMASFLTPGSALVTVSSTAALESIDRGLPTLIIDDFGVSEELLNAAFAGSGIVGSLSDLLHNRVGFPHQHWLADNYFQPANLRLAESLELLAQRSRAKQLSSLARAMHVQNLRRLRAEARTVAPDPVVKAYRKIRYRTA